MDRLAEAAALLLEEVAAVDVRIRHNQEELADLHDKRSRLVRSLESMRNELPVDLARKVDGLSEQLRVDLPTAERSEAIQALLRKMVSSRMTDWKVEQLQNHLEKEGFNVSGRYASNTLRRLFHEGLLVRVGRGLYRLKDQYLAIEGLDERDYE